MVNMEWTLSIKTVSEANSNEHWTKRHKRRKNQMIEIRNFFILHRPTIKLPCTITLTRISPRILDDDNLVMSFKFIRDAIANEIHPGMAPGRADDDKQIAWKYSQEKGKPQAIKMTIQPD